MTFNTNITSMQNWSSKKKLLAIIGGVLAIVGLILTIYLVQKVQEIRSRAAAATTLSLQPPDQEILPGEEATLDVELDPGINQVNFVKFTIKFDHEVFDQESVQFDPNPDSSLSELFPPVSSAAGEITFVYGVASDPTAVVREVTTLGTITLPTFEGITSGDSDVSFNEAKTEIKSTANADPGDNVLASTNPATVNILRICAPNTATCSWDLSQSADLYRVKITNKQTGVVVKEEEVDSNLNQIEFETEQGVTYACEVIAVNECGQSSPSSGEAKCEVTATLTPTPPTTATPRATLTPTPTSRVTFTPTPTTPEEEETPTPTTPSSATATPTTPQGGIATPAPETPGEFVPEEQQQPVTQATPIPTLPPTGSPLVITGIIGGILFLLGGIVLLFL